MKAWFIGVVFFILITPVFAARYEIVHNDDLTKLARLYARHEEVVHNDMVYQQQVVQEYECRKLLDKRVLSGREWKLFRKYCTNFSYEVPQR